MDRIEATASPRSSLGRKGRSARVQERARVGVLSLGLLTPT